jgi:hypothetical protein
MGCGTEGGGGGGPGLKLAYDLVAGSGIGGSLDFIDSLSFAGALSFGLYLESGLYLR